MLADLRSASFCTAVISIYIQCCLTQVNKLLRSYHPWNEEYSIGFQKPVLPFSENVVDLYP